MRGLAGAGRITYKVRGRRYRTSVPLTIQYTTNMKAALCVLLLAVAVATGAEEKKTEKRGLFGLGYGLGGHGYYGHGLGLYSHSAPLLSHGYGIGHGFGHGYGLGLGHGYGGLGGYGYGLGHGVVASAPLISHSYSAPLHYGAPLLGLGHGGWH